MHEQASSSGGRRAWGSPQVSDSRRCDPVRTRSSARRCCARAIASVVGQEQAARIIIVIDHGPDRWTRSRAGPGARRGVRAPREHLQTGPFRCTKHRFGARTVKIVASLDDDACADCKWSESIRQAHADQAILVLVGRVTPEWEGAGPPRWFPDEFLLHRRVLVSRPSDGADGRDSKSDRCRTCRLCEPAWRQPADSGPASAALERHRWDAKRPKRQSGARERPGARIVHLNGARVDHFVPRSRATWSYFRQRCLAEGRSKATVTEAVGGADGLSSERRYVLRTLPSGVLRGVGDACRGDAPGLLRSGAIVAGLSLTAVGYLFARGAARRDADERVAEPVRPASGGRVRLRWPKLMLLGASISSGLLARRRRRARRRRKIGVK